MKRLYDNGVWTGFNEVPTPDIEPLDGENQRFRLTYRRVPSGRYRIRLISLAGRPASGVDVVVKPGETAEAVLSPETPAPPLRVHWVTPAPDGLDFIRFNVNPCSADQRFAVALGRVSAEKPTFTTRSVPPGRYVLIPWDLGAAMFLTVPDASDGTTIDVRFPEVLLHADGERSLEVYVTLDGVPCQELLVLVRPQADGAPRSGDWLRMAEGSPASFAGLAPGTYEVLVFDAAFGLSIGMDPNPLVRVVTIQDEDRAVHIDIETLLGPRRGHR